MKKNLLLLFIFYFTLIISSHGAGSGAGSSDAELSDSASIKSINYKRGVSLIKKGKKLEKKGKIEKAKIRFNKALEYLIIANDKNPDQPDILNYLGFAFRKTGDFIMAEVYYSQGLEIDPNHIGINEYLGELYIETNRIDLAKQRLEILKDCSCEEYGELKELIENN
jgi:tetratricopeptide (TPR) repeat protein